MLVNLGIDIHTAQGIFLLCALYSFCAVTLIWAVGLMQGNHSLMDGYYGFGYVIPGWMAFMLIDAKSQTAAILLLMVSLHGARLGVYLARRWGVYRRTIGADPRYIKFKANLSPGYWWKSFFLVMHSQTLVLIIVSMPAIFGITMNAEAPDNPVNWLTAVGMLVYGVGLYFETVADAQLQAFKAYPENKGKYLRTGVWTHSRHPNYFGTTTVWWGMYLVAVAGNPAVWWTIIGPIINTLMLTKVTGTPMMDNIMKAKPEYQEVIARTRGFFPIPK